MKGHAPPRASPCRSPLVLGTRRAKTLANAAHPSVGALRSIEPDINMAMVLHMATVVIMATVAPLTSCGP
jgi:hypothetical protein